ncbi:hypothetical protein ETD86_15570 [Nonomuraea turkmeniaca]|uniref:Uncharacterized protein n=1 Tax=Nonomuraea turkmeniaca TaxID=103838 RepID=A0A5S4FMA0_9ACTN|nr:hypothetical protein [Nonomuraea turkmeniaca]TMR21321.1 hypothetical protein ETD86_15570 [Nonomuraea turkmeniaca]
MPASRSPRIALIAGVAVLAVAVVAALTVLLLSKNEEQRAPDTKGGGENSPQHYAAMASREGNFFLIQWMVHPDGGQVQGRQTLVYFSDSGRLVREDGSDKNFTGTAGSDGSFQSQDLEGSPNTATVSGATLTFAVSVFNEKVWKMIPSAAVFDQAWRQYACEHQYPSCSSPDSNGT